jgi:hypothetical protein
METSLQKMRSQYKKKDREVVARHLGIDADHPVLDSYLATAVQYDLDPLLDHLWIVDNSGERAAADGEPLDADRDLGVGITRDGLLVVARRDERYGGMEFDAVRSKDEFQVRHEDGDVKIVHAYSPLGGEAEPEKIAEYRGELIGAYCKTYVEGQIPTYYFAWLNEHGQFRDGTEGRELAGTWAIYQSTMNIKAAQSVTLRLAFGVTGVVPVDEIKRGREDASAEATKDAPPDPTPYLMELEIDPDLKGLLIEEVARANDLEPNAWSLSKLKMRLGAGRPDLEDQAQRVLSEIEDQNARRTASEGDGSGEPNVTAPAGAPAS